ncbi:hypothetical protein Hanom_Chr07g00674011 [Helianthus anomalus]
MSWLTRPLHASSCNTNVSFSPCSRQRATRTPNRCCNINHAPTPQSLITRPIYHPIPTQYFITNNLGAQMTIVFGSNRAFKN